VIVDFFGAPFKLSSIDIEGLVNPATGVWEIVASNGTTLTFVGTGTVNFDSNWSNITSFTMRSTSVPDVNDFSGFLIFDNITLDTNPAAVVTIDIKPGGFPNSINPTSSGKIPVAILTTDATNNTTTFDATTVDPATVHFGRTGTEAAPVQDALEDVDGDGDTDMILHFNTQDTGIKCGDTSATLTGETFGGQAIQGTDSIKTVGCK
jgi:hypothetical protein